MTVHLPVMRDRILEILDPRPGMRIVDGTVGGGGHAEAILDRGADVVGVDRDASALEVARARLSRFGARFTAVHDSFANLPAIFERLNRPGADALLLDLGVSSLQLDDCSRGFSFLSDGPLDMRMDMRE